MGACDVRLFIDASLSPLLATRCNETGMHDALHPLHVGRCGEADYRVLGRCIAEDRVVVTQNAKDFLRLAGKDEVHPGLIILPFANRDSTWSLLQESIAFLENRGNPTDLMMNHVLEIRATGNMVLMHLARA
jgi:predicted nuclease of predicted toxin-antitoxin system